MKLASACALLLLVPAASGCSKHPEQSAMVPAAGNERSREDGIHSISDARCEREVRCGNVGVDKKYASVDACKSSLNDSGYSSLDASSCPRGVDAGELAECQQSIRNEECGSVLDAIERLAACRSSKLCHD
jgi:hypothetical protein